MMKRFLSSVLMVFLFVSASPDAYAKKFGGGRSFGKSYKTAPAPKQQAAPVNQQQPSLSPQSAPAKKRSWLGPMLGGLVAGGLLASLFGGNFEGLQILDMLLMAAIVFVVIKVIKGMLASKQSSIDQPSYAGAGASPSASANQQYTAPSEQDAPFEASFGGENAAQSTAGGFGASVDVPHNYPPGFDMPSFINGAREHYRILQGAWNHNQLETIREYVSPEMFSELASERASLQGEQHTEVMYVDAEIVRAEHNASVAMLSLQFSGRYRDSVEGIEEDINDVWHLERDLTQANAPWLIVGIQG